MRRRWAARHALLCAVVLGCGGKVTDPPADTTHPPVTQPDPLRKVVKDRQLGIGVGTAVGSLFESTDNAGTQYRTILAREFDVVTAENAMKFGPLRPTRATFNYGPADAILTFAKQNDMRMRGHVLAWHNQLPSWLTTGTWTLTEAKQLLDEHIAAVVGHYKGQLVAWDVVNEAFTDSPVSLRGGFWADNVGRGYIEQAFRSARAADPDVALFYNDYNIEAMNAKSDSVYALLSDFKARGVPVDGVGMQMHLIAGQLSLASMQENFTRFAALGLKIHITEMDVRVPLPSTLESLTTQAQNYRDVFKLCLDVSACQMIVMWGFTDRSSWIPTTFPGWGDALLYDANFQPKSAYNSVYNYLKTR